MSTLCHVHIESWSWELQSLYDGRAHLANSGSWVLNNIFLAQAAGARAVPILCDSSPKELERIFKAVNGLLIPGGGQNLSPGHPFYDASAALLQMTLAANDAGDFIPVRVVPPCIYCAKGKLGRCRACPALGGALRTYSL